MRSLLVLPLMALGSLAQSVPSDSSSASVGTTPSDTPPVVIDTPSVTPTVTDSGSASPSVTPSTSEAVATTPTDVSSSPSSSSNDSSSSSSSSTDSSSVSATATDDLDDPTATYVIPANLYSADKADEGPQVIVQPSLEEVVDIGAHQVELYAAVVADNKLAPPDNPAESPVAVLPACPNIKAAALRAAADRAQIRVPKFGCVKKTLSIKIHFHYVVPSSKTTQTAKDNAQKRAQRNFDLLNQVYNPFGISFVWESFDTPVNAWFTNHKFWVNSNDDFNPTQEATKKQQAWRATKRVGGFDELNVWIVDDITTQDDPNFNVAGFATFPNWKKKHDGIVMALWAFTPISDALLTTADDQGTCLEPGSVPKLKGGTLIHEIGHWLGLLHIHEGGCSADDGVADTYQVSDGETRNCCTVRACDGTNIRSHNWMGYSKCRGTSIYNRPINPSSFKDGQRVRMLAYWNKYRQPFRCEDVLITVPGKRDLASGNNAAGAAALALHRRQQEGTAKALAELLLHNCSVAIQDVFDPASIPLGKPDLAMYSSSASVLQASPTPVPPGVIKPSTVSWGTNQPTDSVPGGGGAGVAGTGGNGAGSTSTPKPSNAATALTVVGGRADGVLAVTYRIWKPSKRYDVIDDFTPVATLGIRFGKRWGNSRATLPCFSRTVIPTFALKSRLLTRFRDGATYQDANDRILQYRRLAASPATGTDWYYSGVTAAIIDRGLYIMSRNDNPKLYGGSHVVDGRSAQGQQQLGASQGFRKCTVDKSKGGWISCQLPNASPARFQELVWGTGESNRRKLKLAQIPSSDDQGQ
ncbi:hypothetical protein Micbo1qcDRAFT_180235 [Microdochium bolleyi]|uniref:Peptidase M43 pregnancy-associated plasma-A domain-containing protein n=1 Tax=Microdochium bolleyi TaxID=196109 RepID=A0A136IM30_9PEZI|nr:hypothetical protein Micbo1qcDRAFT_180235 [Microdochium bolleyi]